MDAAGRPRIVIAGAGIAGSLIAGGLFGRSDVDLIVLERAPHGGQLDAGTGLNIGPNAIKALRAVMPERAATIVANALPWRRWTVELTDGRRLMDLDLANHADNPGIRIRWAELYALLRAPIAGIVRYGDELSTCRAGPGGLEVITPKGSIADIDLLIAADGRYSVVRSSMVGNEPPRFLGVCLYRLLFPVVPDCPIDDYAQWFNGPNRLLAFRVPGDYVYVAGSFPIGIDEPVTDEMQSGAALRARYLPAGKPPSPPVKFLVDAIETHASAIHWARLQDGSVCFAGPPGVLFVGDAAHPMVPTLGQGATQSVEDACVVVDAVRRALDAGQPLAGMPREVAERRRERVDFVVAFSREATDTMLAGADPVAGTLRKTEPAFLRRLERMYRDAPEPVR